MKRTAGYPMKASDSKPVIDYLVGGFRISIGESSNTPGPRSHIEGFNSALSTLGYPTNLYLASNFPGMSRFSRIREGSYKGSGSLKVWAADLVRLGASLWSGANVFVNTKSRRAPGIIYERIAVFQSLTSFHAKKRRAFRVVEANGILSRETAKDRQALKMERYARWLERRTIRRADLIVAVSSNLRDELVEFSGVAPDRILVVPNGINTEICDIPRRESEYGRRTVGFVGAVVEWQHLDRLISAIAAINASAASYDQEVDLEIIGDGPELSALRSYTSSLNLDHRVRFLGRMSHSDALMRMTSWDVGYAGHEKSSSSSMYHSPLKVYEYAALGISILCTQSADAEMLEASGSMVHFIGAGETALEETAREALDKRLAMDEFAIAQSRVSVAKHHGWEQRVELVMDRVRQLSAVSGSTVER